jgi:hypothetical protein
MGLREAFFDRFYAGDERSADGTRPTNRTPSLPSAGLISCLATDMRTFLLMKG